jgi:hypothetical protein
LVWSGSDDNTGAVGNYKKLWRSFYARV